MSVAGNKIEVPYELERGPEPEPEPEQASGGGLPRTRSVGSVELRSQAHQERSAREKIEGELKAERRVHDAAGRELTKLKVTVVHLCP